MAGRTPDAWRARSPRSRGASTRAGRGWPSRAGPDAGPRARWPWPGRPLPQPSAADARDLAQVQARRILDVEGGVVRVRIGVDVGVGRGLPCGRNVSTIVSSSICSSWSAATTGSAASVFCSWVLSGTGSRLLRVRATAHGDAPSPADARVVADPSATGFGSRAGSAKCRTQVLACQVLTRPRRHHDSRKQLPRQPLLDTPG